MSQILLDLNKNTLLTVSNRPCFFFFFFLLFRFSVNLHLIFAGVAYKPCIVFNAEKSILYFVFQNKNRSVLFGCVCLLVTPILINSLYN